jgi:hypothetical protein
MSHWAPCDLFPHLAYIDPGSGSFAIQIVIASVLGAAYTVKTFWKNIKQKLFGGKGPTERSA